MYQPFDLTGRGVVVTGGNGGIGLGMARALLAAGAKVSIWGNRAEKTEAARAQLAAEVVAQGGDASRVHALVCDVGDEAQVDIAFAQSVAALGTVHACFANAGVSGKGNMVMDMALDEFRRVQRINVEGVFLTFRAAARHMAGTPDNPGQGGSLVATASTAAVEGAARNSHYGASKGAVTAFVRALAVELALLKRVPPRYLRHAHHWLILHGRYICKARKPACPRCVARAFCNYPDKTPATD